MKRSLVGYSLWGCKEADTTERPTQLFILGHREKGALETEKNHKGGFGYEKGRRGGRQKRLQF